MKLIFPFALRLKIVPIRIIEIIRNNEFLFFKIIIYFIIYGHSELNIEIERTTKINISNKNINI